MNPKQTNSPLLRVYTRNRYAGVDEKDVRKEAAATVPWAYFPSYERERERIRISLSFSYSRTNIIPYECTNE